MRLAVPLGSTAILIALVSPLAAQRVVIARATPTDVILAVNKRLSAQGFKLEDSTAKQALFLLDRGLISQNRASGVVSVPVVMEFYLRFKPKPEGLEVRAFEEVVGDRKNRTFEFRQPVRSDAEIDTMQRLLETVKAELEMRPATP